MRRLLASISVATLITVGCSGSAEPASTTSAPVATTSAVATTAAAVTTSTTAGGGLAFVGADGVESLVTDTSRIVTLSGDLTELTFALGLGDSVVATDVTTAYPPEAIELPVVGVGRFLTAEGVLAETPSLVLGDTQTSPPEAIEQIRSAGVPVVIFEVPTTFEGLYEKVSAVGEVLGEPAAGTDLAEQLRVSVEEVTANAVALDPVPRVAYVYSRGPDVMLLFGSEMTTNPLIESAGGLDAGADSGVVGTVSVTPEAIVASAPDVIVTTEEGLLALGGVEGLLATPGFAETPAGRSGRVLAYPEGDFLTFGPRIAETLGLFIADLRAELAP